MSQISLQKTALFCGAFHGRPQRVLTTLQPMAAKYYTHFLTAGAKPKRTIRVPVYTYSEALTT